jgi:predicted Zn-dependent protease
MSLSLQEWKTFLKARITQEQGKDQDALKVFDQILASHPNDPHLIASRAFALQRLGREEESAASRLEAKYAVLGTSLVGAADQPDTWTAQLKSLVNEVDRFEASPAAAATMVAW